MGVLKIDPAVLAAAEEADQVAAWQATERTAKVIQFASRSAPVAEATTSTLLKGLLRGAGVVASVVSLPSDQSEGKRWKPYVEPPKPDPVCRVVDGHVVDDPYQNISPLAHPLLTARVPLAADDGYRPMSTADVELMNKLLRLHQLKAIRNNGHGNSADDTEIAVLEMQIASLLSRPASPTASGVANPMASTGSSRGGSGGPVDGSDKPVGEPEIDNEPRAFGAGEELESQRRKIQQMIHRLGDPRGTTSTIYHLVREIALLPEEERFSFVSQIISWWRDLGVMWSPSGCLGLSRVVYGAVEEISEHLPDSPPDGEEFSPFKIASLVNDLDQLFVSAYGYGVWDWHTHRARVKLVRGLEERLELPLPGRRILSKRLDPVNLFSNSFGKLVQEEGVPSWPGGVNQLSFGHGHFEHSLSWIPLRPKFESKLVTLPLGKVIPMHKLPFIPEPDYEVSHESSLNMINAKRRSQLLQFVKNGWREGERPSLTVLTEVLTDQNTGVPEEIEGRGLPLVTLPLQSGGHSLLSNGHHRLAALVTLVADGYLPPETLDQLPFSMETSRNTAKHVRFFFRQCRKDGLDPTPALGLSWDKALDFYEPAAEIARRTGATTTLGKAAGLTPVEEGDRSGGGGLKAKLDEIQGLINRDLDGRTKGSARRILENVGSKLNEGDRKGAVLSLQTLAGNAGKDNAFALQDKIGALIDELKKP